jgi:tRNA(Ile)-lysidine synthase
MKIYVGVSGGIDSMYLLHQLIQMELSITCINFNHGTQFGYKANNLVKEYCDTNNIKFTSGHIPNNFQSGNKEKYWREERYKFFQDTVKGNVLLLAHHLTDQYVSWIMSRLKVSDRCFIPITNTFGDMKVIRPLYTVPKSKIKQYIKLHKISVLEDPSNTEGNRGRTECELLPLVESIIPQAEGAFTKAYHKYILKEGYPIPTNNLNYFKLKQLIDLLILYISKD